MDPNASAAPAADQTQLPAADQGGQQPEQQAAPQPAGSAPVEPNGTAENPFTVPTGTIAKLEEIAASGYKQEDIDAYLSSIEDEGLRAKVKDSLDGKVHLVDAEPEAPSLEEPFTFEELEGLDPAVSGRIRYLQDQLLSQMDAVEKAREELPAPMQRLLNDPVVRARLSEMEKGPFVPSVLDSENISAIAQQHVAAKNIDGLMELLNDVVAAVPEVILQQRAAMEQEAQETRQREQADMRRNAYMASGFDKLEQKPEFKSSVPQTIMGPDGKEALNPEHPASSFALWLIGQMQNNGMTIELIDSMGGIEGVAYNWLANQRGGFGKIVHNAVTNAQETMREKLLRSRNAALASVQAKTLGAASAGVAKTLLHGVDIEQAYKDSGYSARAMKGLNDMQIREVTKALREFGGFR